MEYGANLLLQDSRLAHKNVFGLAGRARTAAITMAKKFEGRLEVMRVRQNFAAPYLKYKYLYMQKGDLKDKKSFIKRLHGVCSSWPPGIYYLKISDGGVFVRFEISNGKIKKIFETSPATNKPYPINDCFKVN